MNDMELTQLYASRLQAIIDGQWAEAERLRLLIEETETQLTGQLWPGLQVSHEYELL